MSNEYCAFEDRTVEFGSVVPTVEELGEILAAIDMFKEAEEAGVIVREAKIGKRIAIERRDGDCPEIVGVQWGITRLYKSTAAPAESED